LAGRTYDRAGHPQAWLTADLEPPRGRGINLQIELRTQLGCATASKQQDTSHFETSPMPGTTSAAGRGQACASFLVQDPDGYLLRFAEPLGERFV
jgi:hypothetical protein